jgi:hypothetical protein
VKVRPAIVAVPARSDEAPLAATVTVTVPLPVRLVAPLKVSQERALERVQLQPAPVVTETDTASPSAGDDRAEGEIA